MSQGNDSSKLPVPYKPDTAKQPDVFYQDHEWASGKRGGGKVPADYEWGTNPKQYQEELGSNTEPPYAEKK
jgi:hypothetical protein